MSGDYDIRDSDLKAKDVLQYIALRTIVESRIGPGNVSSVLSKANEFKKERYGDFHKGDLIYLSIVTGTKSYQKILNDWAIEFGEAISNSTLENKYYRKAIVSSYKAAWGQQASLDGLAIALDGKALESVRERAKTFGCDRKAYQKVRNYVAGALLVQYDQFQAELLYSWRVHQYDRV